MKLTPNLPQQLNNNNMKKKLYQVGFGMLEDGEEHFNVDRLTVVATDAEQAIKKAKKRKNYFV